MADVALFQRRDADLFGDATYRFLEGQLHVIAQIGTAAGALTAASAEDVAKHVAKDIAEVGTAAKAAAAHAALFKGRVPILVVGRALLVVGQDFVSFFNFFKLGFGVLFWLRSGWYFIARRLYAFLISRSSAVLLTPRIS